MREAEKEDGDLKQGKHQKPPKRWVRILLIICGFVSLVVGMLGIFLPLLPTTPFLLLSAYCFARSSRKFHRWLLGNTILGKYIRNYREGRGMTLRAKICTLSLLWATILVSAYFCPIIYVKIGLLLVAIGVTIHVVRIKT